MEALLGYDTFKPATHGTCGRAIVVGPDVTANDRCAQALTRSGFFPHCVETCTNPADVPRRMANHTEIVVLMLHGFRGADRVALYHAVGPGLSREKYSDFSMVYAGATSGTSDAWTVVFEHCDNKKFPFRCKWCYLYRVPEEETN